MTLYTYGTIPFTVRVVQNGSVVMGVDTDGVLTLPMYTAGELGYPVGGVLVSDSYNVVPESVMIIQSDGRIVLPPTEGANPLNAGVRVIEPSGASVYLVTTNVAPT